MPHFFSHFNNRLTLSTKVFIAVLGVSIVFSIVQWKLSEKKASAVSDSSVLYNS